MGFLAGLPLTAFIVWLADPLLDPVRQSLPLRLVVFTVLIVWVLLASGYGAALSIGRQAKEMRSSPSMTGGMASGCLMTINGIIFALGCIMLVLFYVVELWPSE